MADDRPFLGVGWSFPPTFTRGGADVELVAGEEDIHQSLRILLSTALGERVLLEDFGCDLSVFVFSTVDQSLINGVRGIVSDAILYHEPRIKLNKVDVSESQIHEGVLLISIAYTSRSTNSRYNMVYPFYVKEGATPPPPHGDALDGTG